MFCNTGNVGNHHDKKITMQSLKVAPSMFVFRFESVPIEFQATIPICSPANRSTSDSLPMIPPTFSKTRNPKISDTGS